MAENPTRDRHLFGPGPKRILALDGGGTLGIISLAFLARIEALLRARHRDDPNFRLAQYFDLIGGTSTGAIIAAGLALGRSVAEMTELYLAMGTRIFRRRWLPLPGLRARFDHAALAAVLREEIGDRRLDSADLLTGLALVTKRLDTGSPWFVANNPRAPYWEDPADGAWHGNHGYPLATLVRASAAAPFYFAPELIAIEPKAPPALFVDGGVSPYNMPALPLLMMAQMGAYGLRWPLGEDRLLMVSVGTGMARRRFDAAQTSRLPAAGLAVRALESMITDAQFASLMMLQWLSEPRDPWAINTEIGDQRGEVLGGRPLLRFQRFDMPLDAAWLQAELDWREPPSRLAALRAIDAPLHMPALRGMAEQAAARQVRGEHFPEGFDLTPPGE